MFLLIIGKQKGKTIFLFPLMNSRLERMELWKSVIIDINVYTLAISNLLIPS